MTEHDYCFPLALRALDAEIMAEVKPYFQKIEAIRDENELRMLHAFRTARVAAEHLSGGTGYGYGDVGREKLEQIYAQLFGCEAALVRHQFMSGTHTLAVMLFGVLRPGDTMLSATGRPYDTLHSVLGLTGQAGSGSLADFGIQYKEVDLCATGLDLEAIRRMAPQCKMLYLQRSRGYALRRALTLSDIRTACTVAKEANPNIIVAVDNCYGEFVEPMEPTAIGADLAAGSLIKNPGGGIAPTGGYIVGRASLVDLCAQRLTAPGVGAEIGCTGETLRQLYLGLYFAPGVVAQALKSAVYASALFSKLGYETHPAPDATRGDIITAITMQNEDSLCALCRAVQAHSPIDSFVRPEPWPMPGYDSDVIMAAGAFTSGSSIELSCDAPLRPPYTAFLQGGLQFAPTKAALLCAALAVQGEKFAIH